MSEKSHYMQPRDDQWERDLNPKPEAGRNVGLQGPDPTKTACTAYENKEVHDQFSNFTDDELKRIPIVPDGTRLEQGATYVDLKDEQLREFSASAEMVADSQHWYVPKKEVDYPLWNRLIGIDNPERTDER